MGPKSTLPGPSEIPLIAVVDDHHLVRAATASLLRSYGYATVEHGSCTSLMTGGLANVSCIVTDVQMPEMSGMDLLRRLRVLGSTVPVVLMTAYPNQRLEQQAREEGAQAVLEKPLDCDVLAAAVGAAVTNPKTSG